MSKHPPLYLGTVTLLTPAQQERAIKNLLALVLNHPERTVVVGGTQRRHSSPQRRHSSSPGPSAKRADTKKPASECLESALSGV